jgi:hypothetical protein
LGDHRVLIFNRTPLREIYKFVEMGDAATISRMIEDFEVEERLDAMISKCFKQLMLEGFQMALIHTCVRSLFPVFPGTRKAA